MVLYKDGGTASLVFRKLWECCRGIVLVMCDFVSDDGFRQVLAEIIRGGDVIGGIQYKVE